MQKCHAMLKCHSVLKCHPMLKWRFAFLTSAKPTAKNSVFVNGKSHHTRSIYKLVVFGESIRIRILCKHNCDNLEAIKALQDECLKSCFCKALDENMVKITAEWKEWFG